LLIADEPTTALDVTIQAQIIELMKALQEEFNTTTMIISHNMGVVVSMADEIMVMYLGQIVEYGTVRDVFKKHLHPYTDGLLKSMPKLGPQAKQPIIPIEGSVPEPLSIPTGCRFAPRCPPRFERCDIEPPPFKGDGVHWVRCWLYE
jgi:oligopeptide/dipeptide ABC transporter ATP-binding protein